MEEKYVYGYEDFTGDDSKGKEGRKIELVKPAAQ